MPATTTNPGTRLLLALSLIPCSFVLAHFVPHSLFFFFLMLVAPSSFIPCAFAPAGCVHHAPALLTPEPRAQLIFSITPQCRAQSCAWVQPDLGQPHGAAPHGKCSSAWEVPVNAGMNPQDLLLVQTACIADLGELVFNCIRRVLMKGLRPRRVSNAGQFFLSCIKVFCFVLFSVSSLLSLPFFLPFAWSSLPVSSPLEPSDTDPRSGYGLFASDILLPPAR